MATEPVLLGTAGAPQGAGILVHQVAGLDYLRRHGFTGPALDRMAQLHTDVTEVGVVAERARVGELILSHYLPAEPGAITEVEWAQRTGQGFGGNIHGGTRRPAPRAPRRGFVITSGSRAGSHVT